MEGNKPFFIFDFDGTIADTKDVMIRIANKLASDIGRPALSEDDIRFFRDYGVKEFIKKMRLSFFEVMRLLKKGNEIFVSDKESIALVPGVIEAIRKIKDMGAKTAIITSNSKEGVLKVLGNDISLFDFVIAERNLFGKAPKIIAAAKKAASSLDMCVYVGDEPRDIEAAKKAGVKSVAVLWGFSGKQSLMPLAPEFTISSPSDLLGVFKSLSVG